MSWWSRIYLRKCYRFHVNIARTRGSQDSKEIHIVARYSIYIQSMYSDIPCISSGFEILLRILTASRSSYIDMKPIAFPPRNSRSSGHHWTSLYIENSGDLYHSYTIASWSAWEIFDILWCSWYIPCISSYRDVYNCIFMVYTMYILIYRRIYLYIWFI